MRFHDGVIHEAWVVYPFKTIHISLQYLIILSVFRHWYFVYPDKATSMVLFSVLNSSGVNNRDYYTLNIFTVQINSPPLAKIWPK